ncbi:MAG TPA: CRTAC1 family protein [Isosphaeraceae bacterium]|nr:CRTAC1 family protein [Isosphaeraceae bacterium]
MAELLEATTMRMLYRIMLVGCLCVVLSGVGLLTLSDPNLVKRLGGIARDLWGGKPGLPLDSGVQRSAAAVTGSASPSRLQDFTFPPFTASSFETAGFGTANRFTGPIEDRGSIEQVSAAIATRAERGINACLQELRSISQGGADKALRTVRAEGSLIFLLMYQGKFNEAALWTERAIADAGAPGIPAGLKANLRALLGVIHLRRGETENCLECMGPSSCIFPIAPEAVHMKTSGSREAIRHFTEYLRQRPEDLGVRWLVNIAYMTLGEYPDRVPSDLLIPLDNFRSRLDVGRFRNVAPIVGLGVRGPNMAGGSVFDDFNGDGLPDVFTTSMDVDLGASLFINRGDGTFDDRSLRAGLKTQPYSVNCAQADYDNDGRLDVVMVRGGWENPARLSLLRNKGDGTFEDVTIAAGLGEPIASHSAVWGDFNNDGHLDLFVCGEYAKTASDGIFSENSVLVANKLNQCRLYRNRGNGTFVNVAEQAGVCNDRYAKAAVCGDFDGDGLLDIYVSNCGQEKRLYHNRGDLTFEDVAARLGVTEPLVSFSCGCIDFDNDGRLDILVIDYAAAVNDWAASAIGRPTNPAIHPRLFKNMGNSGFKDISLEAGLDKIVLAMSMGIGDIDNDGFLDIYLGTGRPDYSALMPNILYKNVAGQRFEDVTESSGTGHLQKGHGVSFADWDCDGDLDLFVGVGGAVPGDKAHDLLFQNPGHHKHWLKVKLVGTRTNRAALGAKLRVDLKQPDGTTRSIYRTIGASSNYSGSSLVQLIGLGDAASIAAVEVSWPASRTTQTFRDFKPDSFVEITEGADAPHLIEQPRLPSPAGP